MMTLNLMVVHEEITPKEITHRNVVEKLQR